MTSSPRRRRRGARPKPARGPWLRLAGALALAVVLAGGAWLFVAGRAARVSPQEATARSVALLQAGNASGARDAAAAALRADPIAAPAHLALARAMLVLGDGVSAEAELQRAADAGSDPKLLIHLRAQALLLQGQPDKAVALASQALPQFHADALRVRGRALAMKGDGAGALAMLSEAVRTAPNDGEAWTDLARLQSETGDIGSAVPSAARAVQLAPASVPALVMRGELVRAQTGPVAALAWFEAALQRDPADPAALIEYAATLGDVGRTVDALAATRRALQAKPNSPQAWYLQAVIAARAGNFDLARTLLERTNGAVDDLPGGQLLAGALDIDSGDFQQAIGKLKQLVDDQPMNLAARRLYATALLRAGSAQAAIDLLGPWVARPDADSYALTLAARAYERLGDRATAARLLDRAALPGTAAPGAFSADDSLAVIAGEAAQRPGDPEALVALIRALATGGDPAGALAKAEAAAAALPGTPATHLLVGDAQMLLGHDAEAVAAYRRAAALRFDTATMLRLVDALDRTGQREAAAQVLAQFLSQNPINVAALRLTGQWQLAAGEVDAAIDSLETIRAQVGNGDAALNAALATAYAAAGEHATAARFGETAYALLPGSPVTADAYGWALYGRGERETAAELVAKAVALAPRHPGLRWHLAQIYSALGRKPEAKAQAQAALSDPAFADRVEAMALLAKLG
jgi:cellulose synthase operon protein C